VLRTDTFMATVVTSVPDHITQLYVPNALDKNYFILTSAYQLYTFDVQTRKPIKTIDLESLGPINVAIVKSLGSPQQHKLVSISEHWILSLNKKRLENVFGSELRI
jgi:hypothetical protein